MKFLVASDIHTEFKKLHRIPDLPPASEYDAVLLAGDIGMGMSGIEWAVDFFPGDKDIIYIPGNHEYYRNHYQRLCEAFRDHKYANVRVLNPGVVIYADCIVIGATLWSQLKFHDQEDISDLARRSIADFHVIGADPNITWDVDIHTRTHAAEVQYICERLDEFSQSPKQIIVATHFLPSRQFTHPKYHGSSLNAYFASDLDWIMEDYKPSKWICGHTHDAYKGIHPSGTELICNPFGYPGENASEQVKWEIINAGF